MSEATELKRIRMISLDFDGVLAGLVLGRAWEKTKARRKTVPLVTPVVRAVKFGLASLTEGLRKPLPRAEEALRRLRSAELTICLLTSRTGPRIAAAERWLARYSLPGHFEQFFFNTEGEDADRFKARIIEAYPIDVHIDDDPETLAFLAARFPDRLFVHLNHYRRPSPRAANIVAVTGWGDVPALFTAGRPARD
jgi:phosphoglycolate phosphatase-like HAD superfamily hydrolase